VGSSLLKGYEGGAGVWKTKRETYRNSDDGKTSVFATMPVTIKNRTKALTDAKTPQPFQRERGKAPEPALSPSIFETRWGKESHASAAYHGKSTQGKKGKEGGGA